MNALELATGGETIAQTNKEIDDQIRGYLMDMANTLQEQQRLLDMALKALTVAHKFCGSLTSDVCPDTVAIPINQALANLVKAKEK